MPSWPNPEGAVKLLVKELVRRGARLVKEEGFDSNKPYFIETEAIDGVTAVVLLRNYSRCRREGAKPNPRRPN